MTVEEIVAQVFRVSANKIDDTSSNKTVAGWDSLGHIMLILELERLYGISLSPQDALAATDVASIKHLLRHYSVAWATVQCETD